MNRALVRAAIVAKLKAADALTGVQVELVWPGDATEDEAIYLLPSQGQITVPVYHGTPSAANPLTLEDNFTTPIEIKACSAGQDGPEAEERLEVLVNAAVQTLAADPTLGGVDGLFWATVGSYDGPGPARSKDGVQAYARITFDARSR